MTTHEDAPSSFGELASKSEPMNTPTPGTPSTRAGDALAAFPSSHDRDALKAIKARADRGRVSTAVLPERHGIGSFLDDALGGGVWPGLLVAIGATTAGGGKTSFAMQLVDGFALQTAKALEPGEAGPATPVLVLSEMPPDGIDLRTFARWSGTETKDPEAVHSRTLKAMGDSPIFAEALKHRRIFDRRLQGMPLPMDELKRAIEAVKVHKLYEGRDVWPVVLIDPLHRWADHSKGEVEGLNELAMEARALADDFDAIVLVTADTNKGSAGASKTNDRSADAELAEALRGSYALHHAIDVGLIVQRKHTTDKNGAEGVSIRMGKNRWGPWKDGELRWRRELYRFTPSAEKDPWGK